MYSNSTEHFHLPQYSGNDVLSILDDLNETNEKLDTALFEHGEAIASIMRDNLAIHNELTEIRHENSTIQLEIMGLQAKDRVHDERLDGIDAVISVLTADDPTEPTPDWRDPTSPNFDEDRYKVYINLTTKMTQVENIYPVGIILAFGNTTDPNDIFTSGSNTDVDWDTTWEALDEGYVLQQGTASNVGQKNGVSANAKSVTLSGNTGSHVLTANEIPAHTHTATFTGDLLGGNGAANYWMHSNQSSIVWRKITEATGTAPRVFSSGPDTSTEEYHYYFDHVTPTGTVTVGNNTTTGSGHTHSFSNIAVNYNAESPAYYVRYWKRTA